MSNSFNDASRALFPPLSSSPNIRHCPSVCLYTLISSALTCRGGSEASFNATAISSFRVWTVEDGATRRTSVVLWERNLMIKSVSEEYLGGWAFVSYN